jgi:hypothetical protein
VNNESLSRRRFRVVARPQQRARRLRLFGAAVVVGLLGFVAAAAARQAWLAVRARAATPAQNGPVVVEAAEPLRALAQAAVDAAPGGAAEKAAALKARLPCVADVAVRRSWGDAASTLTPVLRRAVAPATLRGRPAGALGDDGTAFAVPDGVYALSGPAVEAAGADPDALRALAREWPALAAPGAFPSPLAAMSFVSRDEGWQARLEDGTLVLWGRLAWTSEKLARLKEALADARTRAPGVFTADLRFFEDGKVLLRPAAASAGNSLGARNGGLR